MDWLLDISKIFIGVGFSLFANRLLIQYQANSSDKKLVLATLQFFNSVLASDKQFFTSSISKMKETSISKISCPLPPLEFTFDISRCLHIFRVCPNEAATIIMYFQLRTVWGKQEMSLDELLEHNQMCCDVLLNLKPLIALKSK